MHWHWCSISVKSSLSLTVEEKCHPDSGMKPAPRPLPLFNRIMTHLCLLFLSHLSAEMRCLLGQGLSYMHLAADWCCLNLQQHLTTVAVFKHQYSKQQQNVYTYIISFWCGKGNKLQKSKAGLLWCSTMVCNSTVILVEYLYSQKT